MDQDSSLSSQQNQEQQQNFKFGQSGQIKEQQLSARDLNEKQQQQQQQLSDNYSNHLQSEQDQIANISSSNNNNENDRHSFPNTFQTQQDEIQKTSSSNVFDKNKLQVEINAMSQSSVMITQEEYEQFQQFQQFQQQNQKLKNNNSETITNKSLGKHQSPNKDNNNHQKNNYNQFKPNNNNKQNKNDNKDKEEKKEDRVQYCQNHPEEQVNYGLTVDKKMKSQKLICEVCQYTTYKNSEFINRKIFVRKDLKYMSQFLGKDYIETYIALNKLVNIDKHDEDEQLQRSIDQFMGLFDDLQEKQMESFKKLQQDSKRAIMVKIDKMKDKMFQRHQDNKAIVDKLRKKFQSYFKLDDLILKLEKVFEEIEDFKPQMIANFNQQLLQQQQMNLVQFQKELQRIIENPVYHDFRQERVKKTVKNYDENLKQVMNKCTEDCLNEIFNEIVDEQKPVVTQQKVVKRERKIEINYKYIYINQNSELNQIEKQIMYYEQKHIAYRIQISDLRSQSQFYSILKMFDEMHSHQIPVYEKTYQVWLNMYNNQYLDILRINEMIQSLVRFNNIQMLRLQFNQMNDQSMNFLVANIENMKSITELQLHWNDKGTKDVQYYQLLMAVLALSDINKLYIKTDRVNSFNIISKQKIITEVQRLLEYKFKV